MTSPGDSTEGDLRIAGYAAYFEPLQPPAVLKADAESLIARARSVPPTEAEPPLRAAIERLVDAFLVDRRGHADCFAAAHTLGREVLERFGCHFMLDPKGESWSMQCGVLALHSRIGLSPGGSTLGRCSVCGASDFECDHVPGEIYAGEPCHRVIVRFDVNEISLVQKPYDPRCYRVYSPIPVPEMERIQGRPLAQGEVPLCEHCGACPGAQGPTEEDLNPDSWRSER